MKLKKINAVCSLVTALALLGHLGYSVYAYLTLYYNPTLTAVFSDLVIIFGCIHGVLGMAAVFFLGDGTRMAYPRQNLRTVLQRLSAALIFPLLIVHIKTFSLLSSSAENGKWFLFWLLIVVQICFYGIILLHTALSLTRAFVTLGWIASEKAQKRLDRFFYLLFAAAFAAAAFSVVRGQLIMFLH